MKETNYQIAINTVEALYNNLYKDWKGNEKEANALKQTISILKSEQNYNEEQEAHSEVTLEMEMGKEITLKEWAFREKLDESYARQKARRGSLKTAHKNGRDWFISELEVNQDNRKKK